MEVNNPYLPADQQNIDDIEIDDEDEELEPNRLEELKNKPDKTPNELMEEYRIMQGEL